MSFGFSIGDFIAAASLIKDICASLRSVGGSASEYQELVGELQDLNVALISIERLEGNVQQTDDIKSIKITALSCRPQLEIFNKKLAPYGKSLENGKSSGWAKDSFRKMHKDTLNMMLSTAGLKASADQAARTHELLQQGFDGTQFSIRNVQTGVSNLQQAQQDKKRQRILEWISPSTMDQKQQHFYSRRQDNTGSWLLEKPEFEEWQNDGPNTTLWCPGNPGTGKTVMASIVIDYIRKRYAGEDFGIAFVYCEYDADQTASGLISALTRQLATKRATLPKRLVDLYEQHDNGGKTLDSKQCESLLLALCSDFHRTFIIIDALDELSGQGKNEHDTHITERSSFLSTIQTLEQASVRTFVTSRPNFADIKDKFAQALQVEIVASESDIREYLREKMAINSSFKTRISSKTGLEDKIVNTITSRASGMFLMAVLQLGQVLVERTAARISKALDLLPLRLEDTYKETLIRIENQCGPDHKLGMRVLMWISRSKRPLLVDELRHALAVDWDDDEDHPSRLDEDNLLDPGDIVDVCAGLIVIENESRIIRLVHFTAEEFFRSSTAFFPDAETQISGTCLAYLCFGEFQERACSSKREHGGDHFRGQHDREVERMALLLLTTKALLAVSVRVLFGPFSFIWDHLDKLTSLHIASQFGLPTLVEKLLENGADVDPKDPMNQTPLLWAAMRGHGGVVRTLLENNTLVNIRDNRLKTSLFVVARNGHIEVVKLLLERGAEIDSKNEDFQMPLLLAAISGNVEIVKLLIESGAEVDSRNKDNRTPLSWAAEEGSTEQVKLLIEKGAEVNSRDTDHRTPLSWATVDGNIEKVKLLISSGAEVNPKDKDNRTPLFMAAELGDTAVVALLLQSKAEVNWRDSRNHTPIFFAIEAKQVAMARLLLENNAYMNLEDLDDSIETRIGSAAFQGDQPWVEFLLEHGVNKDMIDGQGRTALHLAARGGHLDIVNYFLEMGLDVATEDKRGLNSLDYAAAGGSFEVVERILKSQNSDWEKSVGFSAFHWAARVGDARVIKLLSDAGIKDSEVETSEPPGKWTALSIAVFHCNKHFIRNEIALNFPEGDNDRSLWSPGFNQKQATDYFIAQPTEELARLGQSKKHKERYCDGCFHDVYGQTYHCTICKDFDYCFMCKLTAHLTHAHQSWRAYTPNQLIPGSRGWYADSPENYKEPLR